jgi:WD40 repeat protein
MLLEVAVHIVRHEPLVGVPAGVLCICSASFASFASFALSYDRTLKVWDLATGEVISTLTTGATLFSCALTADGRTIVAGDAMGAVHFVDWVRP